MNPDTRMDEARRRMELRPAARLEYEGQLNDDPNQRADYPRMMFRKTDTEERETLPGADGFDDLKVKDKSRVINSYDGLLCEIITVASASEAEIMTGAGWDVSPNAAHGITEGMAKSVSAKDDRIAELEAERDALRAQFASSDALAGVEPLRRGPGRPRLTATDA